VAKLQEATTLSTSRTAQEIQASETLSWILIGLCLGNSWWTRQRRIKL